MYVLIKNGAVDKFPYSAIQLFEDNRETTVFPEGMLGDEYLATWNVFPVEDSPLPPYDELTHRCNRVNPIFDEATSKWINQWEVVALSEGEALAAVASFKARVVQRIQQLLDDFAKERGYDNIGSATTYASSTILRFRQEAERCIELRDAFWNQLYQYESAANLGGEFPRTVEAVVASMPALTWAD